MNHVDGAHARPAAVPARPGGRRRASRPGRGALAPQRRRRDLRHAGRRGALADRPSARRLGGRGVDRTRCSTRKRQLRELEDEVAAADGDRSSSEQAAVAALGAEVATLRARLSGLEQSVQARQAERVASEKDLEQSVREHERVHRHLETIGAESRQVAGEAAETDALLARLEPARRRRPRDAESRHEAAMAARARGASRPPRRPRRRWCARLTAGRVELAGFAERAEALGRELARLDEMEADFTGAHRAGPPAPGAARRAARVARRRARAHRRRRARGGGRARPARGGGARRPARATRRWLDELRAIEDESRAVQSELNRLVSAHPRDRAEGDRGPRAARGAGAGGVPHLRRGGRRRCWRSTIPRGISWPVRERRDRARRAARGDRPGEPGGRRGVPRARRAADVPAHAARRPHGARSRTSRRRCAA